MGQIAIPASSKGSDIKYTKSVTVTPSGAWGTQTVDVSDYPNYKSITVNNIFIRPKQFRLLCTDHTSAMLYVNLGDISYNSSTGIVSVPVGGVNHVDVDIYKFDLCIV